MKRLGLTLALFAFLCGGAQAQLAGGMMFPGPGTPASSASCTPGTQATTFLARTSGLSAAETKGVCLFINALFSTSVTTAGLTGTLGDNTCAAYFFATNNTTTANLNVISTSFTLTQVGSLTFTADVGYTGDGSTGTFTGTPNPTTCTVQSVNNAGMSVLVQNNRTTNNTGVMLGTAVAGGFSILQLLNSGVVQWDMNDAGTFPTTANTTTKGGWTVNRTAAGATAIYKNGSSTAFGTSAAASGNVPANSYRIFALDNAGTVGSFSSDQASCVMFHAGFNGTDSAALQNACNNALQSAFGNNVY